MWIQQYQQQQQHPHLQQYLSPNYPYHQIYSNNGISQSNNNSIDFFAAPPPIVINPMTTS